MIKRFIVLYFTCPISLVNVYSQNLIPNPSFEDTLSCPDNTNQVYKTPPWYDPTGSSSDYFNVCYTNGTMFSVDVPSNFAGYQNAKTGNAYCGVFVYGGWANLNGREYIAVRLLDSLIQNKKYCVSFHVSLADSFSIYGIDAIGLYFDKDSIYGFSTGILPYTPQVINQGNIIMDKFNWIVIQGVYIAVGGEKFICIGNFYDNANTNADSTTTTAQPGSSYYYIDDVSIILCDSTPEPPPPLPDDSVIYAPNAFSPNGDGENDLFFVQGGLDELHCYIFNRWGEQVAQLDLPKQGWDGRVNGLECQTGVYFYYLIVKDKNGKEITKKGNLTLLR